MASPPRTRPKKRPRQERSRFTVEALLEGTARVLVKEGYDRASTNRIAEAAGVNIGSLYQYFPSKEALVAALIDRHLERIQRVVSQGLLEAAALPLREALPGLIRAHLALHLAEPALHKVLLQQVPRVERLNPIVRMRREIIEATGHFLEARKEELRLKDADQAAFLLIHLIDSLIQAVLLERPASLRDEAFLKELTQLVLRAFCRSTS